MTFGIRVQGNITFVDAQAGRVIRDWEFQYVFWTIEIWGEYEVNTVRERSCRKRRV
jgi:hypothetical protein